MAQQVMIAGALFNNVPAISVPDSNNVFHEFLDTTIASNAASASDIASGKLAYVNGSLITGTGQGGGTLKVGAIRPDAVLDTSWTYDKMLVSDEHVTIPSYSTSNQTLRASGALVTSKLLDNTQYDYIVTSRGIATPVYSSTSKEKGRQEYYIFTQSYEINCVPSNAIDIGGTHSSYYAQYQPTSAYAYFLVYWNSSTVVRVYSGSSYGVYMDVPSHTFTASTSGTPSITINYPRFGIRGNSTYFSSTYWGYLTDIRFQYIVELWKVPRTGNINGFSVTSQEVHAVNCAQSASGDLT